MEAIAAQVIRSYMFHQNRENGGKQLTNVPLVVPIQKIETEHNKGLDHKHHSELKKRFHQYKNPHQFPVDESLLGQTIDVYV